MKRYRVTLTGGEREAIAALLSRGKADVRRLKHAQVLRQADASEDARVAEAVWVGMATVERVRRRFVEEGFEAALSPYRGGKHLYARRLDGEQEAHLVAAARGLAACGGHRPSPPHGPGLFRA